MLRRSALLSSMFLGILTATAFWMLAKGIIRALPRCRHVAHSSQEVGSYEDEKIDDKKKVTHNGNRHMTDVSFLINNSIIIDKMSSARESSTEIEPFPEFKYEESNILQGVCLAKKRGWWILNGDQDCLQYPVYLLKPGSQPKPGAFVSFPGSGNTWLRAILMGITGLFIGSAYETNISVNDNISYALPSDCNCWLLQKTHDFSLHGNPNKLPLANAKTLEKFDGKGILLIRDPFKAIKSYLNFAHGGMTGTAPKTAFQGKAWDAFVKRSVYSWEKLATIWIRGLKQGGVVYYENLYHNTSFELKRILKMIGFNNYDKGRFECGLLNAYDRTFQRRTSVSESPYTEEQKLLIQKAIGNVQLALKERVLDPLPVHYYTTQIAS